MKEQFHNLFASLGYLHFTPVSGIKPMPLSSMGYKFQKSDCVVSKVRSDLLAVAKEKERAEPSNKSQASSSSSQQVLTKYFTRK